MLKKLNEKKDQKKKKNLIQVVISPTTLAQLSMMNNNSFVIPIIVKDDVLHIQSSLTVGTWMTPKEQTQHYYQSMVWGADDSGANDADKKSKMKKKRTNFTSLPKKTCSVVTLRWHNARPALVATFLSHPAKQHFMITFNNVLILLKKIVGRLSNLLLKKLMILLLLSLLLYACWSCFLEQHAWHGASLVEMTMLLS